VDINGLKWRILLGVTECTLATRKTSTWLRGAILN
jgi:hypothetical protein